MNAFVAATAVWAVQIFIGAAIPLLFRALAALGVGFVTYQGLQLVTGEVQTHIFNILTVLPPRAQGLLGLMDVGTAVNILFSAVTTRAIVSGWSGGTKKNFRLKV